MPKRPTAKEFLSDPKYGEEKGFLKEIFLGMAEEIRAEKGSGKKKNTDEETSIFDDLFGGGKD